jgi:Rrf2 family protein
MFNKETEYALRGLVYIQTQNNKGFRPGIDEIAREIDAPRFYTAKILQRLVRQGFIQSLKGKGGGFSFDDKKADLPIKDIIIAIEGERNISGCAFGLKSCSEENPCPLHEKYAPIREVLDKLVSDETIQSLARNSQASLKNHNFNGRNLKRI